MTDRRLPDELQKILALNEDRVTKAKRIAEAIREAGAYRWVGIYDVNIRSGWYQTLYGVDRTRPPIPFFP